MVDGDRYLGMVHLRDVVPVPDARRRHTFARDLADDTDAADPSWTLRRAAAVMDAGGVDVLAVTDADRFVGMVRMADIVRIDEALERPDDPPDPV